MDNAEKVGKGLSTTGVRDGDDATAGGVSTTEGTPPSNMSSIWARKA